VKETRDIEEEESIIEEGESTYSTISKMMRSFLLPPPPFAMISSPN